MVALAAQLLALSEGPNILLDKPIMLVGRHQECDIQIPSRKVSRKHCCIAQVDDHLVVRDLCSTNGIRVNGVRVNESPLKPGDEFTIGNFRYQVSYGASVPPGLAMASVPQPVSPEADPLDSWEEPVALAEPEAPPRHQISASSPPGPVAHPPPCPPSLIFPDNMKLAPLSDSHMPPPK